MRVAVDVASVDIYTTKGRTLANEQGSCIVDSIGKSILWKNIRHQQSRPLKNF